MDSASDLSGKRFGMLTVIKRSEGNPLRYARWECRCDCGGLREAHHCRLISGDIRSCGCARHGLTETPAWYSWKGMLERCQNPNHVSFAAYGGRGIAVCERWKLGFSLFLADMGDRPSADHSIERIDVSGNYEPANCRWATSEEQARNMRRNVWLEYRGQRRILSDWARFAGITDSALRSRILTGWGVEEALTTPMGVRGYPGSRGGSVAQSFEYRRKEYRRKEAMNVQTN